MNYQIGILQFSACLRCFITTAHPWEVSYGALNKIKNKQFKHLLRCLFKTLLFSLNKLWPRISALAQLKLVDVGHHPVVIISAIKLIM